MKVLSQRAYLMTSKLQEGEMSSAIEKQAKALRESTTVPAIIEWLQTWKDMDETHSQYRMRDEQIKIGNLALGYDTEN